MNRENGEKRGKKQIRYGTRCQICTLCGRCGAVSEEAGSVHVLTEDILNREIFPLESIAGERLVTADIGTTTIALRLYGRDGKVTAEYVSVNPQVKYGADVLSRIQAAQEPGKLEDMRKMTLGELGAALASFRPYLESGECMRMVLCGNTTMTYLLSGYSPAELGRAPFEASHLEGAEIMVEGVPCSIFPGQSAFVGGDITAGIFACGMQEAEELTLLIDLGTNGEMVLGNRERMLACATAAGPAFEGGVNRGIWGADMVSILALLLQRGVMDRTGLLEDPYFDEGIRVHDVCVTQQSVRAVQLAKAAIAAGIRILTQEYGLGADELGRIGRVVLAGGFGYYLNPADAVAIGLLPKELLPVTVTGGNTALGGCLRAGRTILEIGDGARAKGLFEGMQAGGPWNLQVINLAACSDFEKYYLENMDFVRQ